VWLGVRLEGRTGAVLAGFYRRLGPQRSVLIEAVSMDMTSIYREPIPAAVICHDPVHPVK
jgi:transposase